MSWEAVSKVDVAEICGVSTTKLNDVWYDMAVALIERHAGIYNIGNPTSVTEYIDGSGIERIQVTKPPIQSVTSVYVDDVLVNSSYILADDKYIVLIDGTISHPYLNMRFFPQGDKNVKVTYVSGGTDKSVAFTIALIVKELSSLKSGEGAGSKIQMYAPNKSLATEQPLIEWGLHGKIKGIITTILGTRFKAA